MAKEMFSQPISSFQPITNSSYNITVLQYSYPIKSYRNTVFESPCPCAFIAKGYDRQAHQAVIGNCSSSLPNGCALSQGVDNSAMSRKDLLVVLTETLVSIISSCDEFPLPSHVAQNLTKLYNKILNNGSNQIPAVE